MRLNPLFLACATALAAGCVGGGGSGDQGGSTAQSSGQVRGSYSQTCVDINHNWQCDDGDQSSSSARVSRADSGLAPKADQYVLYEQHDSDNSRSLLLVSTKGDSKVDAVSTLKAFLGNSYKPEYAQLGNAALETGFARAMAANPLTLTALADYSAAVAANPAAPAIPAAGASLAAPTLQSEWSGADDDKRILGALGSVAVGNNNSNRLYFLDTAAATPQSEELDLIPGWDSTVASARRYQATPLLALASGALGLLVDTVSAASGGTATPLPDGVKLAPGKGINAFQLANGGKDVFVLMNSGADKYNGDSCASAGSEGVYRVGLGASRQGYANLYQQTGCVHSGFNLMAADSSGNSVVAWDDKQARLWSFDGARLGLKARIDVGVSNPQALALSSGGRFAAVAGSGRVAMVDLQAGKTLSIHQGDWGNVKQVAFAAGSRRLLLAAGNKVYNLALDNALQPISSQAVSDSQDSGEIRALAVSADGDSYATASDSTVLWRGVQRNREIGRQSLPAKLAGKQLTFAGEQLLLLARHHTEERFKLYRLALPASKQPA